MKRIIYLAVFGLLAFQIAAYADWVNGTVAKVDSKNNTVTIQRTEDERDRRDGNLPAQLEVKVNRDADLKNIASINDLKTGDAVKIDVRENKNLGIWEAKGIELRNSKKQL